MAVIPTLLAVTLVLANGEPVAAASVDGGTSTSALDDSTAIATSADAGTSTTGLGASVIADAGTRPADLTAPLGDRLHVRVFGATTAGWDGQQQADLVTMHAFGQVRAGVEIGWGPLRARAVASLLTSARKRAETWTGPQAADLGSHLDLDWQPASGHTVALQFFPFDSSVVLPSFDWAQAWGRATPAAPLGRLSYEGPRFGAWVALREARELPPGGSMNLPRGLDVLGGVRLTLGELRVEVRGARIERLAPFMQTVDVGAVGRVTWLHGGDPGAPLDFVTWGSDPTRFERLLAPRPIDGPDGFALTVGGGAGHRSVTPLEGQMAQQTIDEPWWMEAAVRVRRSALRLFTYLRARSVTAAALDGWVSPVLLQSSAVPVDRHLGLSAVAGFDWAFSRWRLTPGLLVRVWQDAAFVQPRFDFGGQNPPPAPGTPRWILAGEPVPLTAFEPPGVAVAVNASARLEVAPAVTLAADLDVAHDPKFWGFVASTTTINEAKQLSSWVVTGTVMLQARTP